ncbi:MAG: glutamate synthase large subunit [Silvanigrellaceae bacterium]
MPTYHADRFEFSDPRLNQADACGVGFVANILGTKSHQIVRDGLQMLCRMEHRGGVAADGVTSDGAGLLLNIPHELLKQSASRVGKKLPEAGEYAVGMTFMPSDPSECSEWENNWSQEAQAQGLSLLFNRSVPLDVSVLGPIARANCPKIHQFVMVDSRLEKSSFAKRLYIFQKKIEEKARERYGRTQLRFHICSLSTDSICYKALTTSESLEKFYPDLANRQFTSSFAVVHRRFSTNTLPAWPLAQPFRKLAHNGEINTLRGNVVAFQSRVALVNNEDCEMPMQSLGPVCTPGMSDSAMFDNAVDFLLQSGRPLSNVLTMMIPEPWEKDSQMNAQLKAYYEYQSTMMEPWDGPALMAFFHGGQVGAILDRNGLRPGRYWITRDKTVICASEAGVLPRRQEEIITKGRLAPGRILLVDMNVRRVIPDEEIKASLSKQNPYADWLAQQRICLDERVGGHVSERKTEKHGNSIGEICLHQMFGYTQEDLTFILAPMANLGKEPDGSMGNDTPLAILSEKRPLIYNYFRQLFAQVTNPPIDCLREERVTSLTTFLGRELSFWKESEEQCHRIRMLHPVLTRQDVQILLTDGNAKKRVAKINTTFSAAGEKFSDALERILKATIDSISEGHDILLLSDVDADDELAPVPPLVVTAFLHNSLLEMGLRQKCSLVVESGEPREVHHFALLIGYGASAVHPWLALQTIQSGSEQAGFSNSISEERRTHNYIKSVNDGLLKIMAKMGISTLQSYRGAQLFEAIGINPEVIDTVFKGTTCRVHGLSLDEIAADVLERFWIHKKAALPSSAIAPRLVDRGVYKWRRDGERHLHNPESISALQNATMLNSREDFVKFCKAIDETERIHLRSVLTFKKSEKPLPLDEVEDVRNIVKRFSTGAMSFGSLSREAHETIAIAMNRIGAKSNSGEGGEEPSRYRSLPDKPNRNSAIKQIASARFGVTIEYLVNAQELQIKIAQGAKPGEGGQLPGHKVDEHIARTRHSAQGITLISPPPHHDIYSIEDLAQLIYDLKSANSQARISVKLVSESGVGTVAAGVAKAKADVILISGCEGGTGASPLSSIQHAGLPWELGIDEAHQSLVIQGLRSRVILQTDGQLRTPRDIAIATLLGAEEWGIATGALVSLGCIMMRKCHLNTCPVGIATQDPVLRERFHGQPEHLINYIFLLAEGLREIMAGLGLRTVDEMVGRKDLLIAKGRDETGNLRKIDLSKLLRVQGEPWVRANVGFEHQDHDIDKRFDAKVLLPEATKAMQVRRKCMISSTITNIDRSVGTLLSSWLTKTWGTQTIEHDTIRLNLRGAAGQSFMAFGAYGISAVLEGECNDYCGKGLSGAKIALLPDRDFRGDASANVICGNTTLYGATSGEFYGRGIAGERFAVRNSGAHAVIEGVGDHCCEYMTGGSVVVLGATGKNFAAGMSGGIAFVHDPNSQLEENINLQMVRIKDIESSDESEFLWQQITNHFRATESPTAARILNDWNSALRKFKIVAPIESPVNKGIVKSIMQHQTVDPPTTDVISNRTGLSAGEEIHV